MALQMEITLDNMSTYSSAYLKITELNLYYKDVDSVKVILSVFSSKEAFDSGAPSVVNFKHVCSGEYFITYFSEAYIGMEDNTPLKCAYEWLKSIETYFDAVDV